MEELNRDMSRQLQAKRFPTLHACLITFRNNVNQVALALQKVHVTHALLHSRLRIASAVLFVRLLNLFFLVAVFVISGVLCGLLQPLRFDVTPSHITTDKRLTNEPDN